jgi:hypothetical protein
VDVSSHGLHGVTHAHGRVQRDVDGLQDGLCVLSVSVHKELKQYVAGISSHEPSVCSTVSIAVQAIVVHNLTLVVEILELFKATVLVEVIVHCHGDRILTFVDKDGDVRGVVIAENAGTLFWEIVDVAE